MMAAVRDGYLGYQGAYRRSGWMRNATVGLILGLVFRAE
jgi:tetrahydromethanopterin S-methyltransferase subunit B